MADSAHETAFATLPPLDGMAPSPYAPVRGGMTVAEFMEFEDPHKRGFELIEGELCVSPPPVNEHQWVEFELALILGNHVKSRGLGRLATNGLGVILSDDTLLIPDIVFIARGHPQINEMTGPLSQPPSLVVEVLSKSTRRRDLDDKFRLYQAFGVENYWIVDYKRRGIDAWTLKHGVYAGVAATVSGIFSAPPFPDLKIELESLWAKTM